MNKTQFAEITEKLETWREELKVPGVSLGISYKGEWFTTGAGVTNSDHPLEVTNETLFQIGSITKTFTATAMMRLVEEGKLDLSAPVRQYLPDFKVADEDVSANVKVQHLLTHSAGWVGDVFSDTGDNDDALALYVEQMAGLEQLAPPDLVFSYNNSAFCTAGRVIEAVTGKRYEDALKELIFEPLGLTHAFFFPKDVMTYRFAVGHRIDEEQGAVVQRPWPIPRSSNPAGGIACHVKDLLRYGEFHLGDGTAGDAQLLSAESLKKMHTPHFPISDIAGSMGLSWFVRDIGGAMTFEHGGGTLGQISQLTIVPEHDFVFAAVTNAGPGGQLIQRVQDAVLKECFGLEDPEPEAIEMSEEELQSYTARYTRPIMDTDVVLEDGKLQMQLIYKGGIPSEEPPPAPPPFELVPYAKDQMMVPDGPYKGMKVEFIRDDADEIIFLRAGARVNRRT